MNSKKIWIGRWVIAVALLHTIAGIVFFPTVLPKLLGKGVFNSVGADPLTNLAVWFLLFGALLAMLGMALTALERAEKFESARPLGVATLLLTVTGVVLMPLSGFWLAFPPAIALLRRRT
jgi:hypothetical protein